jgi:hypothetical protein
MSDPNERRWDQLSPGSPPPGQRSGCGAVILGLVGFLLLLPGTCVILIALASLQSGPSALGIRSMADLASMLPFLFVIFALFAGGILMIRQTFRR